MSFSPNFYIKKKTGLLYLQVKWNGQRLLYSMKENIPEQLWDPRKQRLKNSGAVTKDGFYLLNDLLNKVEECVKYAYRQESLNGGIPTVVQIRQHLDRFFNSSIESEKTKNEMPTFYQLADRFINNEILHKGRQKANSTIKSYKTTLKHIKAFEKKEKYEIQFETITLEFFYKFVNYLNNSNFNTNTKNKYIGVVKAWMAEALDLGYTDNVQFRRKKFSIGQKLVETVYLKEHEVMQLHGTKFASAALTNTLNIFLLGVNTGLRYSDLSSLRLEHIQEFDGERFIKKEMQKTSAEVVIPLNAMAAAIIDMYILSGKGIPKAPCNQVFNKQLKTICKAAGLTEKGRLTESPEKELWECVSAHTARRTFATLAHLNGVPMQDAMMLLGHRSEKSYRRYLRLTNLDAAKRFSQHMKKVQENPSALMKAV